jgi:hypothetical protein
MKMSGRVGSGDNRDNRCRISDVVSVLFSLVITPLPVDGPDSSFCSVYHRALQTRAAEGPVPFCNKTRDYCGFKRPVASNEANSNS